jgi:hypothetical protein
MSGKISFPHAGTKFYTELLKAKSITVGNLFNAATAKKATSIILLLTLILSCATNFTNAQSLALKPKREHKIATPVLEVKSFQAVGNDSGSLLKWKTDAEVNQLGFNIYRDQDGKRTQINQQLITSSVLNVSPDAALLSSHAYEFNDHFQANDSTSYWLEGVDIKGNVSWRGPFSGRQTQEQFITAEAQNAKASVIYEAVQRQSTPVEARAKLMKSNALALKTQPAPPSAKTFKLAVTHEGWYKVSQAELFAAGLSSSVDPRNLQLYTNGNQQPMIVKGQEDGRLDASDSLEFYGQGIDSTFSNSNIYWLMEGKSSGLRMATVPSMTIPGDGGTFPFTIERCDKTIYFSSLLNGEGENFFGAVVARQPLNQTLTLKNIHTKASQNTTLQVSLQGVNWYDHTVDVQVNGTSMGQLNFFGQFPGEMTFAVPPSMWHEGDNVVTLTPLGGNTDITLVDSIRLTYEHTYTADNDYLRFPARAQQQITIWGFTNEFIETFDVTNPLSVQKLSGRVVRRTGKNGVLEFGMSLTATGSGEKALLAMTKNRFSQVAKISIDTPSNWKDISNEADFVIFARKDFFSAAAQLQTLRREQGLVTAIVDIEDVYDEFSFGQKTPQAIRDFLYIAMNNWKRSVKYVLFLGDSSYDPKNYLNFGDSDIVPTKLVDTIFLEAVTDDWFADFNSDYISDIPVGRLPARNQIEAEIMVGKIAAYEQSLPSNEVLLVADTNDVYDFESANSNLIPLLPADTNITFVKRSEMGDSGAKTAILDSFNRGVKVVNYAGHGSIDLWRGDTFNTADAMHLQNNGSLPMVVTMNCLNGYFQDPLLESLSECLLKAPQGGAVAAWGSSSLTFAEEQAPANQELFRLLFASSEAGIRIGEAAIRAKAAAFDADVRYSWILFGDPTMRLK